MSTREALLAEIEKYLAKHSMAHTTFGLRSINDAKLVANLRAGQDVRTKTADRIKAFMKAGDCPLEVGRPAKKVA